jgi:methionyl-tRNA formyltransferase
MNIIISGQRTFGAAVFDALLKDGHNIVLVASPPTNESGGEDKLTRAALLKNIKWKPSTQLTSDDIPSGVDLIVCAHSHAFISKKSIQKTRLGAIGYHPSLLPIHRGRDAVKWTIKMGDRVAGGSVYWLTDQVDAGPIAAQDYVFVHKDDDASELWFRDLFPLGIRLLRKVVDDLSHGVYIAVPQNHNLATWEPSWGRPPIYRPDLIMIGAPEGMKSVVTHWGEVSLKEIK